jgi:hypothetical protein
MYMNLQVEWIFGSNPKKISYMAGFGSNHPIPPHHGGASITSNQQGPKNSEVSRKFSTKTVHVKGIFEIMMVGFLKYFLFKNILK